MSSEETGLVVYQPPPSRRELAVHAAAVVAFALLLASLALTARGIVGNLGHAWWQLKRGLRRRYLR